MALKTLTEFNGIELLNTLNTMEMLALAGKPEEEIHLTIGLATKRDGDKLKTFLDAVQSIKNRSQGLKRVVVYSATETDKIPERAEKRDGHVFFPEYYPALENQERGRRPLGDQRGPKSRGHGNQKRSGDRNKRQDPRESRESQEFRPLRNQKPAKNEVRLKPIPVAYVSKEGSQNPDRRQIFEKKQPFIRPNRTKNTELEVIRQEAEKRLKELKPVEVASPVAVQVPSPDGK